MKLFRLFVLVFAAIQISNAQTQDAQTAAVNPAPNPVSNSETTLSYIHSAWDTLTRSMTDCHSLGVKRAQVGY